ncbi:peptide-N(4)-(N-acetyl-beta-glucosaminyl)asparagine amidase isoform X1 [Cajanus cajan]|uniref:peptide-N(4)-(N-acetyl-beta- glucosaminyl)asparagine amidase isoform X1 n=1 Tax=Cajanus cajan TaxID=3821 RepID=UPI00098DB050|nr:peptide-N(4)-(N-acetyl-beta-glucosaminyl)asparagine amidase isoform X1 [Cajanus cajan]XP_020210973.1 peptide-N(4)-(N-acetyl-beta-glucosaminyl)asparagine amidase isoform X1 [Cajanus cajan]XP_020210974.1 peptide-N(4)-(N-acetyl-beta-glucosaminyl)asparagine amidase isoform X1 [Cajanus cajan]
MVARRFQVFHNDSDFDLHYDTDDGFEVFQFQLYSLTSVPPHQQKLYGAEQDTPLLDDSDLIAISDKLRLVSVNDSEPQPEPSAADLLKSDEELARLLQAEEEALMLQQYVANQNPQQFESRVRPYVSQVLMYEDEKRQEAARKSVPVEELEEKALVSLAKEGNFKPSKIEQDHAFLLQLLFWFKQSFRWVNSPSCHDCGNQTVGQGMTTPLPPETLYGASRVELYRCTFCSKPTRFPRYNDPIKLVETREGRCGEWANCFTLYCRAFGYESRLILDFTDHVWTECFSQFLGRWMHLDPCEGIYDKPLLYEKGWGKKLDYVIAIAKDGVYDVTKRYTRKWHEVLSRRTMVTEPSLSTVLANITKESRRGFASQLLSIIEARDMEENKELERSLHAEEDESLSLPGRRSGNEEWRKSRLEFGSDNLSSSTCPVRLCIDEHVTRIYNAFHPILYQFVGEELTKSEAVEVLRITKGILLDLRNFPYKTRRASISSVLDDPKFQKLLPSFDELLGALSLEKVNTDGRVEICLVGDPVVTSLALPVALDALDDMIYNLNKCENYGKDMFLLPLLKLNRIHSGSAIASSEELPFGIITAAFDGTRNSKWEEPNGAKGCWIMYRTFDNKMVELVAYELMSANDAPERDPMDWVLEGSSDDGISWQVLDKQASQFFEDRFQRRTYIISSASFPCNVFRFRFLAVRDIRSTSRLQIGSIDFYAKSK